MSAPEFLTPAQSRARRELARIRRRRRMAGVALAAAVVIVAAVVLVVSGVGSDGGGATNEPATKTSSGAVHVEGTKSSSPLSPDGLPLSAPAFVLKGVSTPASDPVQIDFKTPPRAGLLFNLDSGQVLWAHDPHERVRIASLTKMMTALLTVKSTQPTDHVLVTKAAVDSAGSKVGVLPLGKHVRAETMLYGLLLPSGNDAAIALAQHVAGSVKAFVQRMNEEAAKLGMACTRYSSPSGYFDAGNFSCAADLALLAHVDIEQRRIARIVRTYSAVLPFPIKGGRLYLYNNNPLLIYRYPGTTGMKTGFTDAAGRCLVATAERDGVRLGVVVLNSDAPGTQARQLLDRGFDDVYHLPKVSEPPIPPGA
ncbi:MAG TPA: D-alanyl-D-alanine carboxypeptidase family protein [Solirubrobacteraceae bacterium]|jgi:D-alanyl-D-alanine carboxypeptidase|nr:D-alanyl-D-alanine carboxypeptidase family protein [Solirubrobacteraceae bacterium]